MILSVQRDASPHGCRCGQTNLPVWRIFPHLPSKSHQTARSAISPSPWRSSLARTHCRLPPANRGEIARAAADIPGARARIDVAPNGYLNLYLRSPFLLRAWEAGSANFRADDPIKTDRRAHHHPARTRRRISAHLRNSALGDTLVRVLRFGASPSSPELHRRHGRPGRRRGGRVPRARKPHTLDR